MSVQFLREEEEENIRKEKKDEEERIRKENKRKQKQAEKDKKKTDEEETRKVVLASENVTTSWSNRLIFMQIISIVNAQFDRLFYMISGT